MATDCELGTPAVRPKMRRPWRLWFKSASPPPVPAHRQVSPEFQAKRFSKLTFGWMGELMSTGYRRTLRFQDIPLINPTRMVEGHLTEFNTHLAAAIVSKDVKNPLFTSLHKTFAREFWIGGVLRLLADMFTVASPYTLRYLIQFAQESYVSHIPGSHVHAPPLSKGAGLLAGIVVMQMLLSLCQNHFLYRGQMVGAQVRAVLTSKILEKSFLISGRAKAGGVASSEIHDGLSSQQFETKALHHDDLGNAERDVGNASGSDKDSTSPNLTRSEGLPDAGQQRKPPQTEQGWANGRIINLVSVDAHRIDQCIGMVHVVWTSPIMILVCMALLIVNLSYYALAGLGCLLFAMFILTFTVKVLYSHNEALSTITDSRVGLTQEALQAIRLVKYFSWEHSFISRLESIRDKETSRLQVFMAIRSIVTALGQGLPTLVAMVSFVTYALGSGRGLNAAVVFSSTALFSSLLMPTSYLPSCLGQAADAWASLRRIEEYLLAEEIETLHVDGGSKDAVTIEEAEFTWEATNQSISDVPSRNNRISGSKSTLGDITLTSKPLAVPFNLAAFSLNIRHGELLAVIGGIGSGKTSFLSALSGDMRKVQGSLTLSSDRAYCPQTPWIQNASARDNIVFGRPYDHAWYSAVTSACQLRRDLEILPNGDATEIGEKGTNLSGGQKQRVSLARAIYSRAEILLLDDPLSAVDPQVGRDIFDRAILQALRGKTRILATHQSHVLSRCDRILWFEGGSIKALGTFEELKKEYLEFCDMVKESKGSLSEEVQTVKLTSENHDEPGIVEDEMTTTFVGTSPKDDSIPADLMQAEDQGTKDVPWAVYTSYLKSTRSFIPVVFAIPLLCLAQGDSILCGLWLAWWAADRFHFHVHTYVAIYVGLAVTQGILLYLFGLSVSIIATSSSNAMLKRATRRVLTAPVSFFDTTPLGRITNRFSKDIDVMDHSLPEALRLFMVLTAIILSIFALIISFFKWFAVALGPLLVIFFCYTIYYRASAREMKRHEAVQRGVVLSRFCETLAGVATIRTFSMQRQFAKSLQLATNDMNSANFLTFSNQRWLAVRLDFIGILLIVVCGVLAVVDRFTQSPAISGLVLSYALGALQVLQFIVRQWADVENAMNATERIYEYSFGDKIPIEGDNGKPPVSVRPSWPEQGAMTFTNVHLRHRPGLPEVLRDFNMVVKPGEHIAIVGRTGAGKSSLLNALFRVSELSRGYISIDGVDVSRVPLSELRSRVSIQPQDSILFRGTVRSNLDPFQEHTDVYLAQALQKAWLADTVHLDDSVEEEGLNFSHGQRQQLGLARLLVRDSKVVVFDEATSNVDLETDERIQRTMAESFRGKTVFTVAHRMRTVINYDIVCVMEQGKIAERGTPKDLWDLGGIFRSMCETSGITRSELGCSK